MKININKKYRYRCGDEARILCVDLVGPNHDGRPQPVASYGGCGEEVLFHFEDGVFDKPDSDDPFDLIEIREPREFNLQVATSLNTCHPAGYFGNADESGRVTSCTFWDVIRVREIID